MLIHIRGKSFLFVLFISTCFAKLEDAENMLEKNILEKLTDILTSKHMELKNNVVRELTKVIENKMTENMIKYDKLLNNTINKIDEINRRLNTIQNEIQNGTNRPGRPLVKPGESIYTLVEVNQTAINYNQVIKRKDFVEVSLSWSTYGDVADESTVTLNGSKVWSGSGDATSSCFKVKKGGRYEVQVKLCNKRGCSFSDVINIIVADTDGSHLLPLQKIPKKKFKQTSGKIIAASYFEDDIYIRKKFSIQQMPVENITHLLYGYIGICGIEGRLKLSFVASCDIGEKFKIQISDTSSTLKLPLSNSNLQDNNYFNGTFGQLMLLKRANPELKILATIGSWYSNPFTVLSDDTKIDIFVNSVKEFLETWKFFNGVIVDWTLRSDTEMESLYRIILKLRKMLNELSIATNKTYTLASSTVVNKEMFIVGNRNFLKEIDFILVKSYGLRRAWSLNDLGHFTSLYAPAWKLDEYLTTDNATKNLIAHGVSNEKIVISVSAYGVGWAGIQNYTDNNPFTGTATRTMIQTELLSYRDIIKEIGQGTVDYHYDNTAEAAYAFNNSTGDLISYDDIKSTIAKTSYVKNKHLKGIYLFGINADNGDLLNAINEGLGNSL